LNLKAFEVAESQIPFNHGYDTATQAPNFGEYKIPNWPNCRIIFGKPILSVIYFKQDICMGG
jgi:hypothetical protein